MLEAFASAYDVEVVWLRLRSGTGPQFSRSRPEKKLAQLLSDMPDDARQQVIDFIEYQLHRSSAHVAEEQRAAYSRSMRELRDELDKTPDG